MRLKLGRLRRGEVAAVLAAAALVALLLATAWFAPATAHGPRTGGIDGWHALPGLRWLIVVSAASALALGVLQAACRAPALPSTMSMVVTVLGAATTAALIVRLATSAASPRAGAFLGLAAAAALAAAGLGSLREEGGWRPDPQRPIERVPLPPPPGRS